MQRALPLQAARQSASEVGPVGMEIGAGLPVGTPFVGLAWVPC
jgi:hypothetical protein